ncbi:SufE family protein [Hyphomicrobiales bacterium]|jgi:cysteine desulfuration protein SufE|nr:SufE family protein [Hyphomicrobiales bacterium]MDA9034372.1 SufE family protein [Hyphomicrobiales bacterium]MDA9904540.1 SufE family protein [Hyphomicrobiales bacterium]MDB4247265.1 SufE family protein [Hyphomicrobiales bacterium]MDB9926435.1 SufE family protein [Hyphomicrobiales bacterium]|tara:strand:- start:857 stop:1270 length:414 start_codon:yes stop_codon:yes gene_type:complete
MELKEIIEDFEFIDEWDDRYKYIMDIGKSLDPMSEGDHNDKNKVDGCASQVWLITEEKNINEKSILEFKADSDSFLVKGLLAIIIAIFSMKTPEDILKIDHLAELKKLNLQENISQQRSNGLRAVITRVISEAQKRV